MRPQRRSLKWTVYLSMLLLLFIPACTREEVGSMQEYVLENNSVFSMEITEAEWNINANTSLDAFAYNNQIPGPLFNVMQGSTVFINVTNKIPMNTTIHWHGLRHKNKDDGVPDVTQPPIQPKESYVYELSFPDAGLFWYHPHIREDMQQEKGLYGVILVKSNERNMGIREEVLVLDDLLLEENDFSPFSEQVTNFVLMGRFGNLFLINGKSDYTLEVEQEEPVLLYLVNVANARPFNVSLNETMFYVVGTDLGFIDPYQTTSVIIGPAERSILQVQFSNPGTYFILNKNPMNSSILGKIIVKEKTKEYEAQIPDAVDLSAYLSFVNTSVDYEYRLTMQMPEMEMPHTEEQSSIEWEDTMFDLNKVHNNKMMKWIIEDMTTKQQNMDIMQEVELGSIKKIRIINDEKTEHPMQHPIHLHGQRFLVLSENEQINEHLGWKDTVLIPAGTTVDLLVEFTNPGEWMMHCHIAEHLESGMMMQFTVR